MTLIGEDRPGLVESLAKTVAEHGANWLESRMAHLAGQFAGILEVEVEPDRSSGLIEALKKLDRQGLTVIVQQNEGGSGTQEYTPVLVEVVGSDRPGIVREVTRVFAELNVNVEDIETSCSAAPMSGKQIFHANVQIRLPNELSIDTLKTRLEAIAGDLMVDITIGPAS